MFPRLTLQFEERCNNTACWTTEILEPFPNKNGKTFTSDTLNTSGAVDPGDSAGFSWRMKATIMQAAFVVYSLCVLKEDRYMASRINPECSCCERLTLIHFQVSLSRGALLSPLTPGSVKVTFSGMIAELAEQAKLPRQWYMGEMFWGEMWDYSHRCPNPATFVSHGAVAFSCIEYRHVSVCDVLHFIPST